MTPRVRIEWSRDLARIYRGDLYLCQVQRTIGQSGSAWRKHVRLMRRVIERGLREGGEAST